VFLKVADCFSLTIGANQWVNAGAMNAGREHGASLVFNGEMVVLGGYNGRQVHYFFDLTMV